MKVRANVATELRDSIEPLCSGASYPIFLAKLWPVFKNILKGDPVFFSMSYEQVRLFGTTESDKLALGECGAQYANHYQRLLEIEELHPRDITPIADGITRRGAIRR